MATDLLVTLCYDREWYLHVSPRNGLRVGNSRAACMY
jgi:hypothetical protein